MHLLEFLDKLELNLTAGDRERLQHDLLMTNTNPNRPHEDVRDVLKDDVQGTQIWVTVAERRRSGRNRRRK